MAYNIQRPGWVPIVGEILDATVERLQPCVCEDPATAGGVAGEWEAILFTKLRTILASLPPSYLWSSAIRVCGSFASQSAPQKGVTKTAFLIDPREGGKPNQGLAEPPPTSRRWLRKTPIEPLRTHGSRPGLASGHSEGRIQDWISNGAFIKCPQRFGPGDKKQYRTSPNHQKIKKGGSI